MTGWEAYTNMMLGDNVEDGAIWGHNPLSEYTSTPGLKGIKAEELGQLLVDRSQLPMKGYTIAGMKCVVLRDQLDEDGISMLNLKTRVDPGQTAYFISIGKSKTTFVIGKGSADAKGGQVPTKVGKVVDHLSRAGS